MGWSQSEVEDLKMYYPTEPKGWLKEYFGRSWSAIQKKASRKNIQRHPQIELINSIRGAPTLNVPDEDFNNYIVGFTDGEGSFNHSKIPYKNQTRFRFAIELASYDSEILEQIQDYLGVGNLHYRDKRDDDWEDSVTYYVTNYGEIVSVIIPFFDRNPPRAPRRKDQYTWWRSIVLDYADFDTERFK